MGRLGFSYVGALFLLALFLPNLLWTRFPPQDYDPSGENRTFLLLERTGQAWVSCAAVIFSDFHLRAWTPWSLFLLGAVFLMALYEFWWFRYFRSRRTMLDFTSSLLGIPVAGASLPVAAFFLLGLYGHSPWMILGTVILGIGHIGIHLQHRNQARKEQKP